MNNNQRTTRLALVWISVFMLVFSSLACALPFRGAQPTQAPIVVSTESAGEMEKQIDEAANEFKQTGKIELQFTETQITSYIDEQLKSQPDQIFTNPQIFLQNGEIQLTGDIHQSNLTLPLKAGLKLQADGTGGVDYELTSATIGPLPLPTSLVDVLTSQIEKALGSNFTGQIPNLYIEEISIADGVMTVRGYTP